MTKIFFNDRFGFKYHCVALALFCFEDKTGSEGSQKNKMRRWYERLSLFRSGSYAG